MVAEYNPDGTQVITEEQMDYRFATEADTSLILDFIAEPMSDWTVYRLAGETLKKAAE